MYEKNVENVLQVENLTLSYGRKNILNRLSFQVQRGDCVGIIGANGCGKSTLLSALTGIKKPDTGTILYTGKDIWKEDLTLAGRIGYVPQENPLLPELLVADNLLLWYGDKTGIGQKQELFKTFGLEEVWKMPIKKLSGGMRKRVSIVCAVANNPELLILDEPGAALDLPCKEDIKQYLHTYIQTGGTVILTSHEEAELSICNRLLFIHRGDIEEVNANLRGEKLWKMLKTT
ncbi:MAG: ATP-binding cassette domain-containing protein [Lachnospiraceae bacterium]|nr:ATP-binding cassette domain-containing protein [Lachnospiraceae bacterium]